MSFRLSLCLSFRTEQLISDPLGIFKISLENSRFIEAWEEYRIVYTKNKLYISNIPFYVPCYQIILSQSVEEFKGKFFQNIIS